MPVHQHDDGDRPLDEPAEQAVEDNGSAFREVRFKRPDRIQAAEIKTHPEYQHQRQPADPHQVAAMCPDETVASGEGSPDR